MYNIYSKTLSQLVNDPGDPAELATPVKCLYIEGVILNVGTVFTGAPVHTTGLSCDTNVCYSKCL